MIARRQVGGRRMMAGVAAGVAAALVLACFVGAAAYGAAYGTLAFWAEPQRISWCGRVYLPGRETVLTRAAVEHQRAALIGDQPYPLVRVATVPPVIGAPVLASVTPQATRDRLHLPCAMVVYLETGPDAYRPYVLSG